MKETDITKMTIGEIVAQDYRAASVFKEAGIDFLEQFEDDLHTHVHLENNILFPKALNFANQNQK